MKLEFSISKGKIPKTFIAPLVFSDIIDHSLSGDNDFEALLGQLDKGVFFKSTTAGAFTCVTWAQYWDNGGSTATSAAERAAAIDAAITATDVVSLKLAAYQWCDTPVVFIDATGAAANALNIGLYT